LEVVLLKRTLFGKLGDFVLGRGFYIVLFLCIATIGITGYFLLNPTQSNLNSQPVTGQPEITLPDQSVIETPTVPPAVQDSGSAGTKNEDESTLSPNIPVEPSSETLTEPETASIPIVFTWPVKGDILTDHSIETLAYSETMGDWRVHSGIDIAASVGTQVLAACGGTVQAVFESDLMGTTIVIEHGEGLVSTYCNLSPEVTVSVGDTVSTGTVIGVVGATAISESAMQPHLHLELVKDGEAVDPVSYLPTR